MKNRNPLWLVLVGLVLGLLAGAGAPVVAADLYQQRQTAALEKIARVLEHKCR